MQQLSGLDTLFARLEGGNSYLHVGPVMVYSPPAGGGEAPAFDAVLDLLDQRLCHWDVLRRKLLEVPWKLDNPYWVDDPDFELKNHVRQSRLRKPGDMRQLCKTLARLHSQPIDRARPLWMLHVIYGVDGIEGLPPGSFALYFKAQHAMMDGATGVAMINVLHDPDPNSSGEPGAGRRAPEPTPSSFSLLSRAVFNNIRQPFKLAAAVGKAVPALKGRLTEGGKRQQDVSDGKERTRFNGPVGPDRVLGFVRLSLEAVGKARRLVPGSTVNDVALAIVSGAMRRYLLDKGELPEISLVAGMPVNVRSADQQGTVGNMISAMSVSLCTDIENPRERLQGIHRQSSAAKANLESLGPEVLTNVTNNLPPYLVALIAAPIMESGLLGKTPPLFNTLVSNVPGPRTTLFFGGAELTMIAGLGPCGDGLGLFHAVSSYCDEIAISFQACATMLPDPEFYTSCIQESWEELKAAM